MQPNHTKIPRGLAIRDDGLLFPATDGVLKQPNFRPYHGDPNASLEERLRYLQGQWGPAPSRGAIAAEAGVFNIATAQKDELMAFVATEYGVVLDGRKSLDNLRNEAIVLAQEAQGGLPAPITGAQAAALDEASGAPAAAPEVTATPQVAAAAPVVTRPTAKAAGIGKK